MAPILSFPGRREIAVNIFAFSANWAEARMIGQRRAGPAWKKVLYGPSKGKSNQQKKLSFSLLPWAHTADAAAFISGCGR